MSILILAANRTFYFGAHLQIVRDLQDGSRLQEIEVQGDFTGNRVPFDNQWVVTDNDVGENFRDHFNRTPETAVDTNGVINPQNYRATVIDIGNRDADDIWNILDQVQDQMRAHISSSPFSYNYDLFYNSNTFVNTLLSVVGVDLFAPNGSGSSGNLIDQVALPLPNNFSTAFPGASVNAFVLPGSFLDVFNLNITGSERVDYIYTGFGDDVISGGGGNDILSGGGGIDDIDGGAGADQIFGGAGRDVIRASSGNDIIDGGLGTDIVDYRDYQTNEQGIEVVENGLGLFVNKPDNSFDTLISIESIGGTQRADNFLVNALTRAVQFIGNSPVPTSPQGEPLDKDGNPLQAPGGGRNLSAAQALAASGVLNMTTGDEDTISVSQALFDAGAQVTYLTAQGEGVIWLEQNGVTQMITYTGIFNEVGQTQFFGGLPSGTVTGLNDTGGVVLDFSGSDTAIDASVLGGISLFNLVDEFIGTDLGDTVDLLLTGLDDFFGGAGDDTIFGGGADNILSGGEGDNTFFGEDGDDILIGGSGADTFDGGTGVDTVDYSGADAGVRADLQGLVAQTGDAVGDTFVGVENLIGTDFVDRLYGDAADNMISGGAGNDALFGRNGDDTLEGGLDNDFLIGGSGNDILLGGEGDDQIQGNLGDDIINGGGGNDFLTGGAGADAFDGGAGIDRVQYTNGTNGIGVIANLGDASGNTNDAAGDSYIGIENLYGSNWEDILYGDAQDNRLDGRSARDLLFGFEGNDFLVGGLGNDLLVGGTGNDKLNGGAGNDAYSFGENAGTDIVLNYQDGADYFEYTFGVFSFADLTITQQGATAVIESASGIIRLSNTDMSVLDASDFLFNSPMSQESEAQELPESPDAFHIATDTFIQSAFYDIDFMEFDALI